MDLIGKIFLITGLLDMVIIIIFSNIIELPTLLISVSLLVGIIIIGIGANLLKNSNKF